MFIILYVSSERKSFFISAFEVIVCPMHKYAPCAVLIGRLCRSPLTDG
jgi:hypothetical protein